jgi:L-fucose isomerase-like protein
MTHAIRVDSRFATPYRTAKILGVSKSRTKELIEQARRFTDRLLGLREFRNGESRNGSIADKTHAKRKSAATVVRKSSGRDGGTKISTTKSKNAKARR